MWKTKRRARLFKNAPGLRFDSRSLHGHWPPLNGRIRFFGIFRKYPAADLLIYHLRMIDPRDRQARRDRYNRFDPGRKFQRRGKPVALVASLATMYGTVKSCLRELGT